MQVAKTVNERISRYAQVTLESCAYAGTGNVLKVQQLLAQAGEHIELKEEESWKVCCPALHLSCHVFFCVLAGQVAVQTRQRHITDSVTDRQRHKQVAS